MCERLVGAQALGNVRDKNPALFYGFRVLVRTTLSLGFQHRGLV